MNNKQLFKEAVALTLAEIVAVWLLQLVLASSLDPSSPETVDFYLLLMRLVTTMMSLFGAYFYYFWKSKHSPGVLNGTSSFQFALVVLGVSLVLNTVLSIVTVLPRVGFTMERATGIVMGAFFSATIRGFVTYLVLVLMSSRQKPT